MRRSIAMLVGALALTLTSSASAAVPGLNLVVEGSGPPNSASVHTATAECPAGQALLGLGGKSEGGGGQVVLDALAAPTGDTVTVRGHEDQSGFGGDWSVKAFAICADEGGERRTTFNEPLNSLTPKVASTEPGGPCTNERRLTGVGAEIPIGATGQVVLDSVIPSADLETASVRAQEDQDGFAGNWSLRPYALCADPLPGLELVTADQHLRLAEQARDRGLRRGQARGRHRRPHLRQRRRGVDPVHDPRRRAHTRARPGRRGPGRPQRQLDRHRVRHLRDGVARSRGGRLRAAAPWNSPGPAGVREDRQGSGGRFDGRFAAFGRAALQRRGSNELRRGLEDAERHYETALRRCELLGARALRARILYEGAVRAAPEALFRREGDFWTVAYAGSTCRLRDVKGLRYLALLLATPGATCTRSTYVRRAGVDAGADLATPADPLLDDAAREAYRRRLAELGEELEQARGWRDPRAGRGARGGDRRADRRAGPCGRPGRPRRRLPSPAERARVSVTKAIRSAIRSIGRHHPALAAHLAASVRTGRLCSYAPPGETPPRWTL